MGIEAKIDIAIDRDEETAFEFFENHWPDCKFYIHGKEWKRG